MQLIEDNLDLAIQLISMGWKVFPCGQDKQPMISKAHGGNGWHDATGDFDQVCAWWQKYPAALVGIACAPSGLLVLDLDRHPGKPDGVQAFAALTAEHGALVEVGPVQETPGNGFHLVFKAPKMPDDFDLPATIAPGVDVRYRGYICSGALADGRAYTWLPDHDYTARLVYPPAWVAKMLVRHERAQAAAKPRAPKKQPTGRLSPGDDYNLRADWGEILTGWKRSGVKGDVEYWTRPGKGGGVSATVNYGQHGNLYVFSTNASPFEPNKSYSKFAAYALLKHGGDFKAAAAALAAAGYGKG